MRWAHSRCRRGGLDDNNRRRINSGFGRGDYLNDGLAFNRQLNNRLSRGPYGYDGLNLAGWGRLDKWQNKKPKLFSSVLGRGGFAGLPLGGANLYDQFVRMFFHGPGYHHPARRGACEPLRSCSDPFDFHDLH